MAEVEKQQSIHNNPFLEFQSFNLPPTKDVFKCFQLHWEKGISWMIWF